jgi:hypothetical protein
MSLSSSEKGSSTRAAAFVLVGVVLVMFLTYGVWRTWGAHTVPSASDVKTEVAEMRQRIKEVGAVSAYDELAERIEAIQPDEQHVYAHSFADALYDVDGIQGISVCDTRFSYGCFHQLISLAILEHGSSISRELHQYCGGDSSCEHGIGHGLLSYEGYSEQALEKSLELCNALLSSDPSSGCRGGIYMEYNMRTMMGAEGGIKTARPLDMMHPYTPCDRALPENAAACYFWLPIGWWAILGSKQRMTVEGGLRQMGAWCSEIGISEHVRTCFGAIGQIVINMGKYEPERIAHLCSVATSNSELILVCRKYAANVLGTTVSAAAGEAVCRSYSGAAARYCSTEDGVPFKISIPAHAPPSL